jgi:cobalt/nickel transport system ATP-binding protein
MSCSLKLKDVCISLDEKVLFEKLDLHISHKEKVAIIGENGCGKTTLLETIAGLHTKQSGLFELFHTPIQEKKDYKPLRDLVGYLFQDSNDQFLAPIVEDDIAFSLLARSLSKLEAKKRVDMILEDFGIEHLRKKVVYNLSGGEKKLVALAGVLVCEPKLMLLDEPTNALDSKMQEKLIQILSNLDKSIIVVSHHKEFIEQFADTIYEVRDKKLVRLT